MSGFAPAAKRLLFVGNVNLVRKRAFLLSEDSDAAHGADIFHDSN
jgi:hypothetical protein